MNIAELEKLIKEQQLELPSASQSVEPARCQWPQYWNNLWTQASQEGPEAAFPENFDEQKVLLEDFLEGEFDDCLYSNQEEAIEIFKMFASAILKDPFVWVEAINGFSFKMYNWLFPDEKLIAQKFLSVGDTAADDLFKLLINRLTTIAKTPFAMNWSKILSRSATASPIVSSATRLAVGRGGTEVAKQTLKQTVKQGAKEITKRGLATLANNLLVYIAGPVDVAVMAAEYASPEALRSSEYQSMLVKDLIATHRKMYLDRKRSKLYDETEYDLYSNRTIDRIIKKLERMLEGTDYRYLVYVPEKTGKVDDAQTTALGTSTADFDTPSSARFEKSKRLFSLISTKSLMLFFKAMENGWEPSERSSENQKILEFTSENNEVPIDQKHLKYFENYINVSQEAVAEGKIAPRAPWIKKDRTIVLVDDNLPFGKKKQIKVTDYALGGDEETRSTTAYDSISLVTLFGGYEGMPQRDELAYWMKLNYFDLLKKIRRAYAEKNSREL